MAAHNYWRFLFHSNVQGYEYLSVAELELRATVGGAAIPWQKDTKYTPVSASSDSIYAWNASQTINGNRQDDFFTGGGAFPHWIRATFAGPTDVRYVILTSLSAGYASYNPKSFTIERSTDNGTSWEIVGTYVDVPAWTAWERRAFAVTAASGAATDWRIVGTKNQQNDTVSGYFGFSEMEFGSGPIVDLPVTTNDGPSTVALVGDGNNATAWVSTTYNGTGIYLDAYFKDAVEAVEHAITAPASSAGRAPSRWTVLTSDDGKNYRNIAMIAGQTGWTAGEKRVFTHASYPLSVPGRAATEISRDVRRPVPQAIPPGRLAVHKQTHAKMFTSTATMRYLKGTVVENGQPARRMVRAYNRATGQFINGVMSNADGSFAIPTDGYVGECAVVTFSSLDGPPAYNAIIFDGVIPV